MEKDAENAAQADTNSVDATYGTGIIWAVCVLSIITFQFIVSRRSTSAKSVKYEGASREDLHLQRKVQHLLSGLMIYLASFYIDVRTATTTLFGFSFAFYVVHHLRKRYERIDRIYLTWFDGILRREEIQKAVLPGAFYFLLGSACVLVIYPVHIARLSILQLSVGDPAASFFGTLYSGKLIAAKKNRSKKSWEGFCGCACIVAVVTFIVMAIQAHDVFSSTGRTITAALYSGISAAIAEGIDVGWDDNFSLPLFSGLFLWLGSLITQFIEL